MKKFSGILIVLGLLVALSVPAFAQNPTFHTTTSIPVTCEENGSTVVIEPQDGAIEPDKLQVTLEGGEKGSFDFSFTEPDIFEYKIYQKAGSNKNVTYDDTVYKATIMVEASDEGLNPIVAIEAADGKKTDEAAFKNPTIIKKASNQVNATKTGDSQWPYACVALCAAAVIIIGTANKKRKEEGSI